MQFKANDGSSHPSQMKAYEASQKPAAPASAMPDQQPKSIQDDPKAMGLVNQLAQMGYSADDVAQAMDQSAGGSLDSGKEATAAAPLNIPGL
jgi:hypothetical protein